MIKANIQFKEKNSENMKNLLKHAENLKGAHVTVGFHEDSGKYEDGPEVVEVALWMEFGTKIIPQRSFIRSTIEEQSARINKLREQALAEIIAGSRSIEDALAMIGTNVVFMIQNKIKSNVPPPLSDSTKEAKKEKGSTNWNRSLMDTETMLRAVGFKVHT